MDCTQAVAARSINQQWLRLGVRILSEGGGGRLPALAMDDQSGPEREGWGTATCTHGAVQNGAQSRVHQSMQEGGWSEGRCTQSPYGLDAAGLRLVH